MTILAFIYPFFTLPYLRLWYFPFVIPMAILAEVVVFIMLDPDLSKPRLAGMIVGSNLLAVLVGFGLGYLLQWALLAIFGDATFQIATSLLELGTFLALLITGVVKCGMWFFVFGPNLYLRRVVIVGHLLCFGVLCASFYILPYFSALRLPDIPLLK